MSADIIPFPPVGEDHPLRRETAADWLIRVGPLAKRLNEQSRLDPKDAA